MEVTNQQQSVKQIALAAVMSNEPLPERNGEVRALTSFERGIADVKKAEIEEAHREVKISENEVSNCGKNAEIIQNQFDTIESEHNQAVEENSKAQDEKAKEIEDQKRQVAFLGKHLGEERNGNQKQRGNGTRKGKGTNLFGLMMVSVVVMEVLSFLITLPFQREEFSWDTILLRFGCVGGICLASVVLNIIFRKSEGRRGTVVLWCLRCVLFLGLLTIVHSIVLVVAPHSADVTEYSLDLAEQMAAAEPEQSNSWQSVVKGLLVQPGLLEMLFSFFLVVLSVVVNIKKEDHPVTTVSAEASSDPEIDNVLDQQSAAKAKLQELVDQKAQLEQAAKDMATEFEQKYKGCKKRLDTIVHQAKEARVRMIETQSRRDHLIDDRLKHLGAFRTKYIQLYSEWNQTPESSVAYEPVTREDLLEYYGVN